MDRFSNIEKFPVPTGYYWPKALIPGNPYQTIYPPKPTSLTVGEHTYKNYLTTVDYGGNGDYVHVNAPAPETLPTDGLKITDDINVYTNEKLIR